MEKREFLGIEFDQLDLVGAFKAIVDRDTAAPFAYVVTPNVDHIVRLHKLPHLARHYQCAWLRLCDSRILAKLARFYGVKLAVCTGSDLAAALLHDGITAGDRIALVGGGPKAAEVVCGIARGAEVVHHEPPMGFVKNAEALSIAATFVEQARARYTFLAVGSPQQEVLASRIAERGGATGVGLCAGAAIDFLTGQQERAPIWMQKASLEWAHRLLSEPERMRRRYLVEGPRIFLIARQWGKTRRNQWFS